ncbi:hypothetical protein C8R44DRAFT_851099 [Mycena epipterygia]|nr:hypothetical protein C8R44DRAFT_851099 [Mycena epipterygia]
MDAIPLPRTEGRDILPPPPPTEGPQNADAEHRGDMRGPEKKMNMKHEIWDPKKDNKVQTEPTKSTKLERNAQKNGWMNKIECNGRGTSRGAELDAGKKGGQNEADQRQTPREGGWRTDMENCEEEERTDEGGKAGMERMNEWRREADGRTAKHGRRSTVGKGSGQKKKLEKQQDNTVAGGKGRQMETNHEGGHCGDRTENGAEDVEAWMGRREQRGITRTDAEYKPIMHPALRENERELVARCERGVFDPQEIRHGVEPPALKWWWWPGVTGSVCVVGVDVIVPFGMVFELEAGITKQSGLRVHLVAASAAQTGTAARGGVRGSRVVICAPHAEGVERRRHPGTAGLPAGSVCRGRSLDACCKG